MRKTLNNQLVLSTAYCVLTKVSQCVKEPQYQQSNFTLIISISISIFGFTVNTNCTAIALLAVAECADISSQRQ